MATEVGVRIKVGATGLENINALSRELRAAGVDTAKLDAEAAELSAELQKLAAQQQLIDQFRQLKGETSSAADALGQAQDKAQKLGRELAETEAPTKRQVAAFEKARKAVNDADEAYDRQRLKLQQLRGQMSDAGVATDELAAAQVRVRTNTTATRTSLEQLQAEYQQTAKATRDAAVAATTAASERKQAEEAAAAAARKAAADERAAAEAAADAAQRAAAAKRAQVEQFTALVRASDNARTSLKAAEAALDRFGVELGQTTDLTAHEQRELTRLTAAVRTARAAVIEHALAQSQGAAAARQAGADVERLTAHQVRAAQEINDTAREARAAATAYRQQGAAAAASGVQQEAAARGASSAMESLRGQLQTLRNIAGVALGGSLIGSLARDLSDTADQAANLQARIKLVTGEGQAFTSAWEGVQAIAQRTSSTLEGTATLFARIAQAGKEIGVSQQDALALTETINQAIQLSGGSADAADAAITQLIQGLQSGVLRGEEFNSVMEQAPRLAQALAAGLGVGTGALREMANQGQLTSQTVIRALQGQSEVVASEFDKLPPTVGRALTSLGNAWTVYVGEVDKANGVSAAAARAINALAANLDTLGTLLFSAGKAVVAYQALKLAGTFAGIGAAATGAAAGVTALTAAQIANNAASATGAVATGRLAAAMSTLKAFSLVGVLVNIKEIGTAIGEQIAQWAGYGKSIKEADAFLAQQVQTSKGAATSTGELSAALQAAALRAQGYSKASLEIIGQFAKLQTEGKTTADAIAEVAKSLDLRSSTGINDAVTALQQLASQGKITGEQVRQALGAALDGRDLAIFEAQARAAFDGSAQGARALGAALDAVADEALKRAGTSARELATGFSEAALKAANDTDALRAALAQLGTDATTTSRLLGASLAKEVEAAKTERAVQAVIERMEQLGRQGTVAGDDLAKGLDKARAKLDELRPGIDGLGAALRTFGLQSREELQRTADRTQQAWDQIRNSTQVSLQEQVQAFKRYAEAATAANNGVEPSFIALQRRILENRLAAAGLGDEIVGSSGRGRQAVDGLGGSYRALGGAVREAKAAVDEFGRSQAQISALKQQGGAVDNSFAFDVKDRLERGYAFDPGEVKALQAGLRVAQGNLEAQSRSPVASLTGLRDAEQWVNIFSRALSKARSGAGGDGPVVAPRTVNVNLQVQGRQFGFSGTAEQADQFVQALEQAKRAAGGG